MSDVAQEIHAKGRERPIYRKRNEKERATSSLWIEDQAAGWMVPGDLLKWNS